MSITIPNASSGNFKCKLDIPDNFRPKEAVTDMIHSTLTNKMIDFFIGDDCVLNLRTFSQGNITNLDFNGNTTSYTFVYY